MIMLIVKDRKHPKNNVKNLDMLAYGLKVPGYTDLQIKMGKENPEKLMDNPSSVSRRRRTNNEYEKLFNESITEFESESKVETISTDIIQGKEPNIDEFKTNYKTLVFNKIIEKIKDEKAKLSTDTLTYIKDKLLNFPNMEAFNRELKGVNKANEALEAKVKNAQEDEAKTKALVAKAKALVESAKQVQKSKTM